MTVPPLSAKAPPNATCSFNTNRSSSADTLPFNQLFTTAGGRTPPDAQQAQPTDIGDRPDPAEERDSYNRDGRDAGTPPITADCLSAGDINSQLLAASNGSNQAAHHAAIENNTPKGHSGRFVSLGKDCPSTFAVQRPAFPDRSVCRPLSNITEIANARAWDETVPATGFPTLRQDAIARLSARFDAPLEAPLSEMANLEADPDTWPSTHVVGASTRSSASDGGTDGDPRSESWRPMASLRHMTEPEGRLSTNLAPVQDRPSPRQALASQTDVKDLKHGEPAHGSSSSRHMATGNATIYGNAHDDFVPDRAPVRSNATLELDAPAEAATQTAAPSSFSDGNDDRLQLSAEECASAIEDMDRASGMLARRDETVTRLSQPLSLRHLAFELQSSSSASVRVKLTRSGSALSIDLTAPDRKGLTEVVERARAIADSLAAQGIQVSGIAVNAASEQNHVAALPDAARGDAQSRQQGDTRDHGPANRSTRRQSGERAASIDRNDASRVAGLHRRSHLVI